MTQDELNELASDCRLAFGHQAGAYNDGVDAMLRAVSIAQAQAAAPSQYGSQELQDLILAKLTEKAAVEPVGYFYFDDGVYKQAGDPISFPECVKLYTSPPNHTKAMRLALEALIDAFYQLNTFPRSEEHQRVMTDCDAAIAALEEQLK